MSSQISSTVQRAIKILNFLNESPEPQSIKNLSEQLNISPSMTHRLLTTLKIDGLVFQDIESKKYSLGTVFIDYANKLIADIPIISVIDPHLIKLRDTTNETVGFYMLTSLLRMCVSEHVSNQQIARKAGIGNRLPLHEGSGGRVILAFLEEKLQSKILNTLPKEKELRLLSQLETVKVNHYSINKEEITENVSALSAPIFGAKGKIIGSITISGPSFRWDENKMQNHIPSLIDTAKAISNSLK